MVPVLDRSRSWLKPPESEPHDLFCEASEPIIMMRLALSQRQTPRDITSKNLATNDNFSAKRHGHPQLISDFKKALYFYNYFTNNVQYYWFKC
jgi:hypothetical protein